MHSRAILLSLVALYMPGIYKSLAWSCRADSRAKDAIDLFTSAYADYKKYAWGHDSLAPVSKAAIDDRNGWGATIVDAMSTMKMMGLEDLFSEAVDFSSKIDFSRSKTSDSVSVFETTIRYLGGLISAYELDGKKNQALIDRSRELGDKLARAWVGLNDIPYNNMDFSETCQLLRILISVSLVAVAGTLVLEWSKLAEYTGNKTYCQLAEKAMSRIDSPLPGLPAQGIDPSTGKPVGDYIPEWTSRWLVAVDSSIRYLAQTAVGTSIPNLMYLGDYTGGRAILFSSSTEILQAATGSWEAVLTGNDTIVQYGLRLTDACWNSYEKTRTGIGPEVFAYIGPDGGWTGESPTPSDLKFYQENGFYVYNGYGYYDLRPEVLESNFYAWRATGDIKYFNRAIAGLESIKKYCRPGVAVDGIWDVRQRTRATLTIQNPSFLPNTPSTPILPAYPGSKNGWSSSSAPWTGEVPQISNVPGIQKKLSDVIEQGL
ncbi:glycosyl hydrolase 47 family [Rhizoctonia solani]|uniref:alpha-1,2-Mannosidase n=1 Tax=Rhizoctonia solani TaxID=456999 RepID=A0A8H7IEH0_9AGAM|nr:glycosyl hydrolase 47 family [Rhizoctonia solani]